MQSLQEFINSGILEQYILGNTSEKENEEVALMCSLHPQVNNELDRITESLLLTGATKSFTPNDTVKPLILATVDYTERIRLGEVEANPPLLNEKSSVNDYNEWLIRPDMQLPNDAGNIYIRLIASNPQVISAIVWIKDKTPAETHSVEHERFLIVEGSCDIMVNDEKNSLVPGNYFAIPLFADHVVKVTSTIPCKVILQRVAV